MATKIRIKLPIKRAIESSDSVSSAENSGEDDGAKDDVRGEDDYVDAGAVEDHEPDEYDSVGAKGRLAKRRSSAAPGLRKSNLSAVASDTLVAAPSLSSSSSSSSSPSNGTPPAAEPELHTPPALVIPLSGLARSFPVPGPAAAESLRNATDGRELVCPEAYRAANDLTAEERLLLDKFARSKIVKLPVLGRQQSDLASRVRAKQELDRQRQESARLFDRGSAVVKRPRLLEEKRPGAPGYEAPPPAAGLPGAGAVGAPGAGLHRGPGGMMPPPPPAHLAPGAHAASSAPALEFGDSGLLMQHDWYSREHTDPLILELPRLRFTADEDEGQGAGKFGNTVVVWATMPQDSERFCVNIQPTPSVNEKDAGTHVLYHFNPRDGWGKRHVVQNTFARGVWGQPDKSIPGMPITKGRRFELQIRITPGEFLIFVDGAHVSTFRNRCDPRFLRAEESLYLVVPTVETHFGDKEDVRVHRIWWGYLKAAPVLRPPAPLGGLAVHGVPGSSLPGHAVPGAAPPGGSPSNKFGSSASPRRGGKPRWDESGGGGGSSSNAGGAQRGHQGNYPREPREPQFEDKQLFVSGLSMDPRSAHNDMLRLFEPYGIAKLNGEPVMRVVEGKGFGFVTLATPEAADEAIKFLNGRPGQAPGSKLTITKAKKKGDGGGHGGRGGRGGGGRGGHY
jgi:hypothetical protein